MLFFGFAVPATSPTLRTDTGHVIKQAGSSPFEIRYLDTFQGISASGNVHLIFLKGLQPQVKLMGDPNGIASVKTVVVSGVLQISGGPAPKQPPVTLVAQDRRLNSLAISGLVSADLDRFFAGKFSAEVSGASKLRLNGWTRSADVQAAGAGEITGDNFRTGQLTSEVSGAAKVLLQGRIRNATIEESGAAEMSVDKVQAFKVELELSGASKIMASGRTNSLKVECSGASNADLGRLITNRCNADASGAAQIDVSVQRLLTAKASGAGKVKLKGKAAVRASTSGAGVVYRDQ